ncbi:MAG: SGNH/GDSL hydrolase family protein [Spirochaetes bacterium]|nr:SGNH/GDSL hydrolase family protein [Spirochaetota bacterium]
MKRIMVIADSIAMPRDEIRYEDTWIYLLKREFPHYDIIDRPGRGSTSVRLVTEGGGGLDLLERYMPQTVILQQGMAECAPRLFDKRSLEYYLVSKILPAGIRKRYIDYVRKHRGRNPDITDVSPKQFGANINSFFRRAGEIGAHVYVIPILPAADILLAKSPRIGQNIDRFNGIYHEAAREFHNVTIVDPFRSGIDINEIAIDEIHINAKGLRMIYEALKPHLMQDNETEARPGAVHQNS